MERRLLYGDTLVLSQTHYQDPKAMFVISGQNSTEIPTIKNPTFLSEIDRFVFSIFTFFHLSSQESCRHFDIVPTFDEDDAMGKKENVLKDDHSQWSESKFRIVRASTAHKQQSLDICFRKCEQTLLFDRLTVVEISKGIHKGIHEEEIFSYIFDFSRNL